jgi:putative restriction endonuclease
VTLDALQRKLSELNVWKRGNERAPHKPLLLLLAMGRAARGEDRLMAFGDIEGPLTGLLRHYGPPRRAYHPEFPFRYLATDGLWEVPNASSWGKKHLRDQGVKGGLTEPLHRMLAGDPANARLAARRLLDEHFPTSMHQHILEAVGLWDTPEPEYTASRRLRRDPHFREAVLTAYERRCAVCDFDLRLKDDLLGLEAAHIQWHSHGGPDRVANGLALCTFHHGAFDRGAIGLEKAQDESDYRIVVSQEVHGMSPAVHWLLDYHDRPIRPPQAGTGEPEHQFVAWHAKQVFRAPPRGRAGAQHE